MSLTNALKQMKPETCDLYRHYDKEWNLLYVGISLNAIKRMIDHRSQSREWFDEIAFTQRKTFPSRAEAEKAEAIAIRNENPKWNKDRPLGTASQDYGLYTRDEEEAHLVNRLRNKVIEQGNSISFLHAEIKRLEAKVNKYWEYDTLTEKVELTLKRLEKRLEKHEDRYAENLEIDGTNWAFLMDKLGFSYKKDIKQPNGYTVPEWQVHEDGILGSKNSASLNDPFKVIGGVTEDHTLWLEAVSDHLGFEWDSQKQEFKKKKLPKGGKRALEKAA